MAAKAPPHQPPLAGIVVSVVDLAAFRSVKRADGRRALRKAVFDERALAALKQAKALALHRAVPSKRMRGSNQASSTSEAKVASQMTVA